MADLGTDRKRIRDVGSHRRRPRYRGKRIPVFCGHLPLPGTRDHGFLLSGASSSRGGARNHLLRGARIRVRCGGRIPVCRGRIFCRSGGGVPRRRVLYLDRFLTAQTAPPGGWELRRLSFWVRLMNVQVIRSEDVPNLGRTGDVVKVRAGFARNYLLPRHLAVEANQKNIREFEHNKRVSMLRRERQKSHALTLKEKVEALAVV